MLRDVVAKAWRENILFTVLVELTYRCNLDCFFCYNDLTLSGRAMRLGDYVCLFDDLAEMGVLDLTLSGGEPLAHPDFFAIGRAARERGFVVRIKSNGHALRGAIARRLRDEIDPFTIDVSLHGGCAETHDRQTRVPGSFDQLLSNLADMAALGLRVKMNSTLTKWNESEVEAMFAIADRFGMPIQFDPTVTPRDDRDTEPLSISPSGEGLSHLFRVQMDRAREGGETIPDPERSAEDSYIPAVEGKHCGAGSSGVAVDPFGNVYPCVAWRTAAGNLFQQSIREIWEGSRVLAETREATVGVTTSLEKEGPAGKLMSFCPGLALKRTGSPEGVTEDMRRRGALLLEEMKR